MPKGSSKKYVPSLNEFAEHHICSCGREFFVRTGDTKSAIRLVKKMVKLHEQRCELGRNANTRYLPRAVHIATAENPNDYDFITKERERDRASAPQTNTPQ
tara:strand:- start:753 stop:1055 length:303 start_codon:yes stop_codon:yes gene_type:complete